jgi:hypothetical protein
MQVLLLQPRIIDVSDMNNIAGFNPAKFDPFSGPSGLENFNSGSTETSSAQKSSAQGMFEIASIDVEKNKDKLQSMGIYNEVKRLQAPLV